METPKPVERKIFTNEKSPRRENKKSPKQSPKKKSPKQSPRRSSR